MKESFQILDVRVDISVDKLLVVMLGEIISIFLQYIVSNLLFWFMFNSFVFFPCVVQVCSFQVCLSFHFLMYLCVLLFSAFLTSCCDNL